MEKFRRGIVAVLRNERGEILLCERSDHHGSWQFPQGGIETGERPEDAFFRELREELGNGNCRILQTAPRPTRYRWPQKGRDGVSGQEQTWFLGEFLDGESPNLEGSDQCFRAYRWVKPAEALALIVHWKQPSFRAGLEMLGVL